jgi:hypothetical protein
VIEIDPLDLGHHAVIHTVVGHFAADDFIFENTFHDISYWLRVDGLEAAPLGKVRYLPIRAAAPERKKGFAAADWR